MAKSYPLTDEIARKNERVILHALAGVTARHVCEVSGLAEFSSYWQAAGKVLTQTMWEHKFFQLLARQKAQGAFASKPKDPSHRRLNQPQQGGNGAGDGQPNSKRGVLRPLGRMV